jgi:2-polyprenyl-3-methyl-5-hydroxy-6-metoxy-1,4-benzoquinol methylase
MIPQAYNPDQYWQNTQNSYPHYPTVRHRKRFILSTLKKFIKSRSRDSKIADSGCSDFRIAATVGDSFSVFDFGCGEGTLLKTIQQRFNLNENKIGGCDISQEAVLSAKQKIHTPHITHALFPTLTKTFDVMICSEVLEHTTDYANIIQWMSENLSTNGIMILTTQAGTIHASDRYTGHTQHFVLKDLSALVESFGLQITVSRLWGWPLFTLQKYLTNIRFERIQNDFLEGGLSFKKRFIFGLAYTLYFIHDLIPFGPQVYIVARKK